MEPPLRGALRLAIEGVGLLREGGIEGRGEEVGWYVEVCASMLHAAEAWVVSREECGEAEERKGGLTER